MNPAILILAPLAYMFLGGVCMAVYRDGVTDVLFLVCVTIGALWPILLPIMPGFSSAGRSREPSHDPLSASTYPPSQPPGT